MRSVPSEGTLRHGHLFVSGQSAMPVGLDSNGEGTPARQLTTMPRGGERRQGHRCREVHPANVPVLLTASGPKPDGEPTAKPQNTLDGNRAVVGLNNFLDDRQSQPRASAAGTGWIHLVKTLENTW